MDASELGGARAQAPAVKGRRSQSLTPAVARFRLTEGRCRVVVQCGMWLDRLIRPGRSCSYLTEIIMPGCREQERTAAGARREQQQAGWQAKTENLSPDNGRSRGVVSQQIFFGPLPSIKMSSALAAFLA